MRGTGPDAVQEREKKRRVRRDAPGGGGAGDCLNNLPFQFG